jgi:hypothetical protein
MAEGKGKSKASLKITESDVKAPLTVSKEAYHLEAEVEEGAHIVVEIAAPLRTIEYDQGTIPDGKLDLKFPVPQEEGDVLLRIVQVADDGERTLVHSETV